MEPLVFEKTLGRSRDYPGALGAVAFVVLESLRRSGVAPERVGEIHDLLHRALPALSTADANTLCDVLFARLHEELRRSRRGEWYLSDPA